MQTAARRTRPRGLDAGGGLCDTLGSHETERDALRKVRSRQSGGLELLPPLWIGARGAGGGVCTTDSGRRRRVARAVLDVPDRESAVDAVLPQLRHGAAGAATAGPVADAVPGRATSADGRHGGTGFGAGADADARPDGADGRHGTWRSARRPDGWARDGTAGATWWRSGWPAGADPGWTWAGAVAVRTSARAGADATADGGRTRGLVRAARGLRSEEHTSELQSR